MALSAADGKTVWDTDAIPNPTQRPDHATNPTTQADFALGDAWQRICDLEDSVNALKTAVAKIPTTAVPAAPIDTAALAAAIAPGVVAGVKALLEVEASAAAAALKP